MHDIIHLFVSLHQQLYLSSYRTTLAVLFPYFEGTMFIIAQLGLFMVIKEMSQTCSERALQHLSGGRHRFHRSTALSNECLILCENSFENRQFSRYVAI